MAEPMLSLQGIHKRFGEPRGPKGVDLDVAKGEVVCILGPSGSGKSTLLRCVNLLEPPEEGEIFLEGNDICKGAGLGHRRGRAGTSTSSASGSGWSSSSSTSSPTRRRCRT